MNIQVCFTFVPFKLTTCNVTHRVCRPDPLNQIFNEHRQNGCDECESSIFVPDAAHTASLYAVKHKHPTAGIKRENHSCLRGGLEGDFASPTFWQQKTPLESRKYS